MLDKCFVAQPVSLVWLFCQVSEKDEAASMKDWILKYAEQSSDEEEEEEDEGDKRKRNPELDEKFDPVSWN